MISCPKCKQTLPDWAQKCQFCGADVRQVARPVQVKEGKAYRYDTTPKFVWPAYYAACGWFILTGIVSAITIWTAPRPRFMGEEIPIGFPEYLGTVFAGISVILGLGLIARIEFIRGVVNFVCGMNIIFGLFSLAGAIFGSVFGIFGVLSLIRTIVDLIVNTGMIFLIGETEKRAPNL